MEVRFIVDSNVGKLARWLRLLGYDTLFFKGKDDGHMVDLALKEGRIVLTRDTQIMKRRVITSGRLQAILIQDDDIRSQVQQVVQALKLDYHFRPFSRCLECNQPLVPRSRDQVESLVPPYVFRTQTEFMQCPACQRIYWRGTHWQAMSQRLRRIEGEV